MAPSLPSASIARGRENRGNAAVEMTQGTLSQTGTISISPSPRAKASFKIHNAGRPCQYTRDGTLPDGQSGPHRHARAILCRPAITIPQNSSRPDGELAGGQARYR